MPSVAFSHPNPLTATPFLLSLTATPSSQFPLPSSSSKTKPKHFVLLRRLRASSSPHPPPPPPPPSPPVAVNSRNPSDNPQGFLNPLPIILVSAVILCVHTFLRILPRNFAERWLYLLEFSDGAESKVTQLPYHLIQAVMASEDRRFFYHFGVDPYGIGRAVVFYPNGGGGSTITQQLVKNIFLTSERKISRKFVEGLLSLVLERRLTKWKILHSYLNKMYWGHGKYGIESASLFYFGKHPSLLNVGESALLAGILPAPEALNPFTNPKKGKASQARALRRMVAAGYLDLETALAIVSQPLSLRTDGPAQTNGENWLSRLERRGNSATSKFWNWEMAGMSWEAKEDMEEWAMRKHTTGYL